MNRFVPVLVVLCFHMCLFSQKSEILFRSGIQHPYAIGYDYYVENGVDTSKLMFMGNVRITSSNQDVLFKNAVDLLKTKAKELNGNSYRLKSFTAHDTILYLVFDIYFSSDKQLELIKANRIKSKILVFNNIKDTLSRVLFVNGTSYSFSRSKYCMITLGTKECQLSLDSTLEETKIKTPKEKPEDAFFYTIKVKEKMPVPIIVGAAAPVMIAAALAATAAGLANKMINPSYEKLSVMRYNTGRILMEIYKPGKYISVP